MNIKKFAIKASFITALMGIGIVIGTTSNTKIAYAKQYQYHYNYSDDGTSVETLPNKRFCKHITTSKIHWYKHPRNGQEVNPGNQIYSLITHTYSSKRKTITWDAVQAWQDAPLDYKLTQDYIVGYTYKNKTKDKYYVVGTAVPSDYAGTTIKKGNIHITIDDLMPAAEYKAKIKKASKKINLYRNCQHDGSIAKGESVLLTSGYLTWRNHKYYRVWAIRDASDPDYDGNPLPGDGKQFSEYWVKDSDLKYLKKGTSIGYYGTLVYGYTKKGNLNFKNSQLIKRVTSKTLNSFLISKVGKSDSWYY